MNTHPKGQQAASPQSTEPTKVTIRQRVRRLGGAASSAQTAQGQKSGWERRLETLVARTEHLELVFEGLQDPVPVHRRAVREDENIGEFRRRMEPTQRAGAPMLQ